MAQSKKGLILAGGGAKGSYQIGVWQALTELGWAPDIITGTSVGSLNGAMFTLDAADTARAMWLTIRSGDVMQLPHEDSTLSELHGFLQDVLRQGGLDVSPLEEIVDLVLDEPALRNAPIAFGLVTVEMLGLRRKQLPLCDIPNGKVKDYLLASAACFPAFRPREIDGTFYLDGGYQDLMPYQLAIDMGATELVCVDIDGVGFTRKNPLKSHTITIESSWDLGDMLSFCPEQAARNIAYGYHDTLRAFGKVRGSAYAVQHFDGTVSLARFRVQYDRFLLASVKYNPTLALSELAALTLFSATDKPLAPLEIAAKAAMVDASVLYTFDTLCDAFLAAYQPERATPFAKMWAGICPTAVAHAGVAPDELIAALVFTALTNDYANESEVFSNEKF